MKEANKKETHTEAQCFHCGDTCGHDVIVFDEKKFCCNGCKSVYALLSNSQLCDYYELNPASGTKMNKVVSSNKFAFLESEEIAAHFTTFSSDKHQRVKFYLPQIHCSSCIWLLENLQKLSEAIYHSSVEFTKKEIEVNFDPRKINIRQVAELLAHIGYEPYTSLNDLQEKDKDSRQALHRKYMMKIGVAGFCWGNIMMLTFPEYLGLEALERDGLPPELFRYLNMALIIPTFFYSAWEFFENAWYSFKQRRLNIDAPIALALVVTFGRSVYEVVMGTGGGFFDSLSGIIFFMLIGRALQNKTFDVINLNKEFSAYFPLAVARLRDKEKVEYVPVHRIDTDDHLVIYNEEVIPVDAMLIKGRAEIDYSFVTGEEEISVVKPGSVIYAGGRQKGGQVELRAIREFSQSSFVKLWNQESHEKKRQQGTSYITQISNYFSYVVIAIAATAFIYWSRLSMDNAWLALTAVLIIACPCALLLTATFTQGFLLNIFGRYGLFLKNGDVLKHLPFVNHIVFDKTGTLTQAGKGQVAFLGEKLEGADKVRLKSIFSQSKHPLSQAIQHYFKEMPRTVEHFKEHPGKGMEAWIDEVYYKIGSAEFLGVEKQDAGHHAEVWVQKDGVLLGKFEVRVEVRKGIDTMLHELPYPITLLSGDNESSKEYFQALLPQGSEMKFKQSPDDKYQHIKKLQAEKSKVMMLGDGLNDLAALKAGHVGIAVVENVLRFSPSSDGILMSNQLMYLDKFIRAAKASKDLIIFTFIISVVYNVVGLTIAVMAKLSPLIAAILMSSSTLSIVLITWFGSVIIRNTILRQVPVIDVSK